MHGLSLLCGLQLTKIFVLDQDAESWSAVVSMVYLTLCASFNAGSSVDGPLTGFVQLVEMTALKK